MSQAQKEMYMEQEFNLIENLIKEADSEASFREVVDYIYKKVRPNFVQYEEIKEMYSEYLSEMKFKHME